MITRDDLPLVKQYQNSISADSSDFCLTHVCLRYFRLKTRQYSLRPLVTSPSPSASDARIAVPTSMLAELHLTQDSLQRLELLCRPICRISLNLDSRLHFGNRHTRCDAQSQRLKLDHHLARCA